MANEKRLEFIEQSIERVGGSQITVKGWAVTLVAAVLALGKDDHDPLVAYVALLVVVCFAGLDCYLLAVEGALRDVYDVASAEADGEWAIRPKPAVASDVLGCLARPVVWVLYLPLAAVAFGLVVHWS